MRYGEDCGGHIALGAIQQRLGLGADNGVYEDSHGTGFVRMHGTYAKQISAGREVSCATPEDWFDPHRLDHDFVPTGFLGYKMTRRPVPGHEFGLDLDEADRKALIAYLKTLWRGGSEGFALYDLYIGLFFDHACLSLVLLFQFQLLLLP